MTHPSAPWEALSELLDNQPLAALLIDNRSNRPADFLDAVAVTATCEAREVSRPERAMMAALLLARHEALTAFVHHASNALICVAVERYRPVARFQQVVDPDMHT